ncbi:hypothetical protein J7T55_002842 [Diaporthe amygdali]|uniref:uncharacterized protein n=1 Tax=Phomopsis amygdali TaxID=1214568 RepID=UPI0022FF180A|nr:uncharacterized protein J7T55_002842 [Diaporthe amygdali]KAJ0122329.1 hypothetical protein J7T55_002842 [Diaporthe amygdali]
MSSTTASSPVEAPSAHMQTVSRKETYYKPAPEEWEAVRLTIRQLYIDENKTLSEVSEILEKLYSFRASPKQYKNRFKQWGLWKNLSTRDAARLIQMKASRDSIGKTSTFVRSGQKLDFDRVQKTIRRSKNRVPKNAAEEKSPKLGRAEPAPPACNQPSRVECRTPSPEPSATKDSLDLLDSLDSNGLRIESTDLHTFSNFGSETFHTHVSDSFLPFTPSDAGQFEPFDSCHYEDPRVEMIWDCYVRAHHKLALRCESLRTNAHSDPCLKNFRRKNSLLAVLEPVLATSGHHNMRELFLANFVATFLHRPELSKFAQNIGQTINQASTDIEASSHHPAIVEGALQYLGLQSYTRRFIDSSDNENATESPSLSDESTPAPKIESSDGLSPDVDLPSPGTEMPPTPPSCNDYDEGPQAGELEAAAFAYHLGELDTAEIRLRAFTCYDGAISTKGQVLIRLAWYCLSCVQRESKRDEEAEGSLMQAIRGSTFYPTADGTEWEEVSYLFM